MPTNHAGRLATIAAVVLGALLFIFVYPPTRLFDHNASFLERTNFNLGIDISGGVRLIYEIEAPPGTTIKDLAEQVKTSLQQRVDPNGVRGIIWITQGQNRLEILLPLTPQAREAPQIQKSYQDAVAALAATNVQPEIVTAAVESTQLTPAQRAQTLSELAMGSASRRDLIAQMQDTWNKMLVLRANPQKLPEAVLAAQLAPLRDAYSDLKDKFAATNILLDPSEQAKDSFLYILDQAHSTNQDQRKLGQAQLDVWKKQFADFPARLAAMTALDAQYDRYQTVKDAITGSADLKRLLQGSGILEFHILAENSANGDQINTANANDLATMDARLSPGGKGPAPQPGDTIRWMQVEDKAIPEFQRDPEVKQWNGHYYMPVLITPDASLTKATNAQWGLEKATAVTDPSSGREVNFEFNAAGADAFSKLTGTWYKQKGRLAIVLDGKLISAPTLQAQIGRSGVITGGGEGGFDVKEQARLVNMLSAGSLPAQLSNEPISEDQISPTLGADNLRKGLVACGFGLIVVAIFLVCYYYTAGLVAFCAVLMNLLIILGVMCAFNATFTLPAIAGIVLTVGTAVDANVLVFERLIEEQLKGLPLRMALRNSYAQAQTAIIDSNMTSAITSICLYRFGSEEVRGFGLTLLIGITASLFTALFVTKTVFAVMVDRFRVTHLGNLPLTFPKWHKALRPNWDWMGKAWLFYTFSIIMITIGMTLFVVYVRDHTMMDIEFSSGTSVQFKLKEPMDLQAVRKLIDAEAVAHPQALPAPSVVSVGADNLHYEVLCTNDKRQAVNTAILDAMRDPKGAGLIDLQTPSTFDGVNEDAEAVMNTDITPIGDSKTLIDGVLPRISADPKDINAAVGGAAIALNNISPPLSANQIKSRLDSERLSATGSLGDVNYVVQSPSGDPDKPGDTAVIVAWSGEISYLTDQGRWMENLVQPLWRLTRDAVNRPPQFEKETNFDPQVAGQMQRDAFMALFFSVVAIMIYIWIRFGNLKYGTATVIALLHDTIFTLAAVGFAHYISDPNRWPDNFLQLQPFRINLTLVAGILTIMGYSMIDTIVVFDRIRENRGKYGHLNRQVINDAINQTLSRTLLTAGTSIITVSFMYFLGGEGIHGFTFVLLIGILVGTYSSVAIAAPLLLLGREAQAVGVIRSTAGQLQRAS